MQTVVRRKKKPVTGIGGDNRFRFTYCCFYYDFIARAYTVNGESMLPTLHHGERLLVDKISYRFTEPARGGEIIVFKNPANQKEQFIKRVIGLPGGDKILIDKGVVYINDQPVGEDYTLAPARIGFSAQVVPENTYFVLGDNRNNSEDSRFGRVGFLPRQLIVGRAVWRYWPLNRLAFIFKPEAFQAAF